MAGRASIFSIGIITVQIAGMLALVGLEILSGYRAGVMQHLFYNKIHYLNSLYGGWIPAVHLAGVVLCGVILMGSRGRNKMLSGSLSRAWSAILCLAPITAFLVPWFSGLNTYAYLLIWLEVCLVLEVARVLGCSFGN